jgi:hypothetical protein
MAWNRVRLASMEHDGARRLAASDDCYCHYEYKKGNFGCKGTNVIGNFKKSGTCKSEEKYYRNIEIENIASILSNFFNGRDITNSVIIPIPSSKLPSNPEYSQRYEDLAIKFNPNNSIQIIPAISIIKEIPNAHNDNNRDIDLIYSNLVLNRPMLPSDLNHIYILDDVLTTGAHYKACEKLLLNTIPDTQCHGLFIAQTT